MKYCMAILLVLASFNSYAGLTKWVDANGTVHYSDGPPPENVQSESVRVQTSSAGHAEAAPASGPGARKNIYQMEADLNKERKAREDADKKAAQKEQEAETKRQNCAQAQNQLNTLRNAPRVSTYDSEGNRSVMSDDAREQSIKAAEDSVSQYCN